MSKKNFTFNAEKNLTAPAGSVDELLFDVDTITISGVTAPAVGSVENYSAHVAWTDPGNTGDSCVVWNLFVNPGNTGTAVMNQKGIVDFSASDVGDVYVVEAESTYQIDSSVQSIVTSPSIDGGRIGSDTGGHPATITPVVGQLTVTVA